MATYYVSPVGDDTTGDGSAGTPWKTFYKAIGSASSTDTIKAVDGTYTETLGVSSTGKSLTITSVSEDWTKVTVLFPNNVNGGWFFTNGSGGSSTITIRNLTFDLTNVVTGVYPGIHFHPGSNYAGITGYVHSCYFKRENTAASFIKASRIVLCSTTVYLYKNTFDGAADHVLCSSSLAGITLTVKDNIFTNAGTKSFATAPASITEDYNCWYSNTGNDITPSGTHNITSDPGLDTNGLITGSSPCLDTGTLITTYVTTYSIFAPDIGVHELALAALYVDSSNGSDTTGTGSSLLPYATIKKAMLYITHDSYEIICKEGTYEEDGFSITHSIRIRSYDDNYKNVIIKPKNLVSGNGVNTWIYINTTGKSIRLENISLLFDASFFTPDNVSWDYYVIQVNNVTVNIELLKSFFRYNHNSVDGHNPTFLGRTNGTVTTKCYKCTFRGWKDTNVDEGYALKDGGGGTGTYDVQDTAFEGCHNSILAEYGSSNYNSFYNNSHDIAGKGANSITSDPLFSSSTVAEVDTSSSPCEDAGTTVTGYVDTYGGAAPDIGCAEIDTFVVTTNEETDLSATSVTLNGTITDLGGEASCYVYFRYWIDESAPTYYLTPYQTMTTVGTFNAALSGLTPGTTYKYEACAIKTDLTGEVTGSEESFTTYTYIVVTTKEATDITKTTVTLNGSLDDSGMGSGDSFTIRVWFEYRLLGASTWSTTTYEQLTAIGDFDYSLTGLTAKTNYEFRAKSSYDSGDGEVSGTTKSFKTVDDISITTDEATDIGSTTATVNGNVSYLGGNSSVKVWFEYGKTTSLGSSTSPATISSTGDQDEDLSSLDTGTVYYFRIAASKVDDSGTVYGTTYSFETDDVFTVTTLAPTNLMSTSVTLNGDLDSLGDYTSTKIWFEYWKDGGGHTDTTKVTVTAIGEFSYNLSGLDASSTYNFHAHASKSDDTDVIYGSDFSFVTVNETIPVNQYLNTLDTGTGILDIDFDEENNVLYTIAEGGYLLKTEEKYSFDLDDYNSTIALSDDDAKVLCQDDDNIFVGTYTSPGKLLIIDKSDFTEEASSITLDSGDNEIISIANDDSYVFIGLNTSPGKVVQYNKSTGDLLSLSLTGGSAVKDLLVSGQYIYAVDSTKVYKINKEAMTLHTTYSSGQTNMSCITSDGTDLWMATDATNTVLIKLTLSSGSFSTTTLTGYNNCKDIEFDYRYLYLACNLKILQVDYSNSTVTTNKTIGYQGTCIDKKLKTFMFVGCDDSDSYVYIWDIRHGTDFTNRIITKKEATDDFYFHARWLLGNKEDFNLQIITRKQDLDDYSMKIIFRDNDLDDLPLHDWDDFTITDISDVSYETLKIVHQIDGLSEATFELPRYFDKPDYTKEGVYNQISNKNTVTIAFRGVTIFSGKVVRYEKTSEESISVTCMGSAQFINDKNKVDLSLSSVNVARGAYDVIDASVDIEQTDEIDTLKDEQGDREIATDVDKLAEQYYNGVCVWKGYLQKEFVFQDTTGRFTRSTSGTDYFDPPTSTFVDGDTAEKYYLDNPTKTPYNPNDYYDEIWYYNVRTKQISSQDIEYYKTYTWVGGSLDSIPSTATILSGYYIAQNVRRLKERRYDSDTGEYVWIDGNDLGYYYIGSSPYLEVSAPKTGKFISVYKYITEDEDSWTTSTGTKKIVTQLFKVKEPPYDYLTYVYDYAYNEYQRLLYLKDIYDRENTATTTKASIKIMLDALLFYGVKLLTQVNLVNTIQSGIYKSSNGFPIKIKTITINCYDCTVTLDCDNELTTYEKDALETSYDIKNFSDSDEDDYIAPYSEWDGFKDLIYGTYTT